MGHNMVLLNIVIGWVPQSVVALDLDGRDSPRFRRTQPDRHSFAVRIWLSPVFTPNPAASSHVNPPFGFRVLRLFIQHVRQRGFQPSRRTPGTPIISPWKETPAPEQPLRSASASGRTGGPRLYAATPRPSLPHWRAGRAPSL